MSNKNRIYSIDLLRFIAAITVVMFHYTFRGKIIGQTALDVPLLSSYFKYGYFGVHLFFIISGFVILLSIQKNSIFLFIKSRIVRLYPAYWVCAIITFLVILFFGETYFNASLFQLFGNLSMLNGFFGVPSIDGVYWSLHVELIFYFLIFILLLSKRKWKQINDDHFIFFWLIISYTPFLINYENYLLLKLIRFVFIFKYSSFFIAGMLFLKIYKSNLTKYKLLLLPTLILSLNSAFESIYQMRIELNSAFSIYITALLIFSFYLIFFLITTGFLDAINKPIYLKIGLLTYPLYLIHQVFGFIIFNQLNIFINDYLLLFLVVLFMFIISIGINKYIEQPFSRKIDKILSNQIHNLKYKLKILVGD